MGLVQVDDYAAPLVEKGTKRQQRGRRTAERLDRTQRIMTVALCREAGVLVDADGESETAARREVLLNGCGGGATLPETHALGEIAAIVRQGHRQAEQVEFGVAVGEAGFEGGLLTVDFGFDSG